MTFEIRIADSDVHFPAQAGQTVLDAALKAGQAVLFEGAQGCLLDLDHGTYPYVTSSSTIAAGACQSVGLGPTRIGGVLGISKAYATRATSSKPIPPSWSAWPATTAATRAVPAGR